MAEVLWDQSQAGIKIARTIINNFRYADDITNGRQWRRNKEPLDEGQDGVKKLAWNSALKAKIQASSPITPWHKREKVKAVTDFLFFGSKITADGDCSHTFKGNLLLERKAMTNLDSLLKCRDITLPTKVHIVKATVFPVSGTDVKAGP